MVVLDSSLTANEVGGLLPPIASATKKNNKIANKTTVFDQKQGATENDMAVAMQTSKTSRSCHQKPGSLEGHEDDGIVSPPGDSTIDQIKILTGIEK